MTENTGRLESLFAAAAAISSPDERAAFLGRECAGDLALRGRLEILLDAHQQAGRLLDRPATESFERNAPSPTTEEQEGAVVAGRFKLLELLGEGGMGAVWLAEQTEPVKRRVALKLVKPGMDSRAVLTRFEAERQALALMDHPNIAKVLDGGATEQGRPYFVMELVRGLPLTDYCDSRRLSVRERLDLFVPICSAIQHAHQKGIIHRDLKPTNILVVEHDGRPAPKVIDFGLAKALGPAPALTEHTLHTAFGAVVGTPLYMAPEQVGVNALDVDTRSDVYSLGVILYELLTGTTPLEKARLKEAAWDEIRRVIREEEPPKPSARLSDSQNSLPSISAQRHTEPAALTKLVRGELDWIVMKALEKDRNRRYETANGLAMDVQRYLADEPVQACPTSRWYELKKLVRRHRATVSAALLVATALVAGVVGTTIGFVRENKARFAEAMERANAEKARDHAWDALDAMTSAVTGESLATQKEVTPEQKQFLRSALDSYRVLAEDATHDEKSRARAAHAARRVGHIELTLGEFRRAAESCKAAAESFAALAVEFPESQDYRRTWSLSLSDTGVALRNLGRVAEAAPMFQQSTAIAQRLAAEHPGDYRYRSDSAIRLWLLAGCLLHLDRIDEAVQSLDEAKALLEKLVEEKKDLAVHRVALAACHDTYATVAKKRSNPQEEERHYRLAIELLESTSLDQVGGLIGLPLLSDYYHDLGKVLIRTGRREEGLKHVRHAIEMMNKQVDRYPGRPEHHRRLALAVMEVARHSADLHEAIASEQTAISVLERLMKENPDAALISVELAGLSCNLGLHLRQLSRIPESIAAFDKAVVLLDEHRRAHGATPQTTDFLGKSLNGRALSKEQALQWRSAADDHRRVVALVPPKEVATIRLDLALCLAKAGDAAAAISELELVERDRSLSPFETFIRSRIQAMLAGLAPDRKQEFSNHAVAGLEKALRGGLSRPLERLRHEDFKELRDRDDFKRLVADMEAKQKSSSEISPTKKGGR